MSELKNNLDEIFRKGFEGLTETPSEKVIQHLRLRLWLSDFFSFNFRKFNLIYLLIIAGSTFSTASIFHHRSQIPVNKSNLTNQKNDNKIAGTIPMHEPVLKDSTAKNTSKIAPSQNEMPVASFVPAIQKGCVPLKVKFNNKSKNARDYFWDFGNGKTSTQKNPTVIFERSGGYNVNLKVTNEDGHKNVYSQNIIVYARPVANVEIDVDRSNIIKRKVVFLNHSTHSTAFQWNFGDNTSSTQKNAEHTYTQFGNYKVTMIAVSNEGCSDTTSFINRFIEKNYELSFPSVFRPGTYNDQNTGYYENAEQKNLIFYPLNNGAKSYKLKIFAPNGVEVFSTNDIKQGWNGYIKGTLAPSGKYNYVAKGLYPNGKKFEMKSSFELIINDTLNNNY